MSKISIYEVVPVPKLADKLVGTSVGGDPEDITYNFTLSELLNLFIPNIPGNTLQGVLDFGNTATQNINLTGIITTTTLNVGSTANILNSNLTGQTHITGGLYDRLNSIGTAGQVLTSTGTQVAWYTIPIVIPDLQQVLTSGNTAVNNIILTGNLSANNAALLTSTISTSLTVLGTLRDGLSSVGANNQVLSSNVTGVRWVNLPVYSATSPLLYNSGTGVFSIQQANASQNGYLSSADWITFDGKQTAISLTTTGNSGASTLVGATINVPNYTLSGLGGVPLTRTLTINGVTYNLAADRSWTLATGVSSVSATTPLFSTGGVNPDISIQQADSVLNGYLSSADWLTFNSKQPAGNYITSLTGEATGAGPGATAVTLSTTAVTGKLLTGLNLAAGGTISATDSILIAFGKTQNQISALLGGVIFKGVWNANTNTPTLVSSVGTQGWYYIVNVAGTTNLNGITDWQVGDWAIFNGTVWDKVDNTDAVSSVNGFTGAVNLTTDNIPEGATNLYYTNTRARAALSFVAGSGAYNNTTGVITIPTNNNQITNGANYITLASLSAVSPLSYINTTGVFSIQVANTSQDGYLSSIDWNTFNNKQATITLTTTGTSGAATLVGATLNIPQYQSVLTNPITGTGTTNTLPKFTAASTIGNSNITDTGSLITLGSNSYVNGSLGIGVQAPLAPLQLGNGYTESEYDGFRTTGSPSLLMAYGQTSVIHRILGGVYSQAATVNLDLSLAISKNKGTGSGFRITSGVGTGVGTSNNYLSFSSLIGASDETFTATEYMRLDANGALGIGTTSLALASLRVAKTITGGTTIYGIWQNGTVQSDVTSSAIGFLNTLNTAASAFTLSSYTHINLQQNTLGAGSSITNQYGVFIDSSLTGATNNYGFFGNIPSGTNRWNLYMNGTASNYMLGSLGIGTTILTGYSLRVSKTMTGGSNTVGINCDGMVLSDSTSSAAYFSTFAATQAASFNLGALVHFNASRGTIGASSSITNQYGFVANDTLTGATNNYGFFGNIASGTNRWNIYMQGTAANYIAGSLGIGSTGLTNITLRLSKTITGSTTSYGIYNSGTVQSDVTGAAWNNISESNTAASAFTLANYYHYGATQGTIGAGSAITTQRGFFVNSNLIGATINYGFQGSIPSGTNRWNLYMDGTAANYMAGSLGIGSTSLSLFGLRVSKTITGGTINSSGTCVTGKTWTVIAATPTPTPTATPTPTVVSYSYQLGPSYTLANTTSACNGINGSGGAPQDFLTEVYAATDEPGNVVRFFTDAGLTSGYGGESETHAYYRSGGIVTYTGQVSPSGFVTDRTVCP